MIEGPYQKEASEEPVNDEGGSTDQVVPSEETPLELAKALQIKRWEVREGPFQGFGSPRGKF